MKNGQLPIFAELILADSKDFKANTARKFAGTDNPRHLRVIHALMLRPRRREEIDIIAGASNGPALISDLRDLGLRIPCQRTPAIDRDGCFVKPGIYAFDDDDLRAINTWLRKRDAAVKAKP